MAKIGNVKVIYTEGERKKTASGKGEDMGAFIKVTLNPSKRRKKFDTVLIPWNNVAKVIVMK